MIVMLAVGILFTIMDRMISSQLQRERALQMALSEASALDALVRHVSLNGPLEPGSSRTYELAGVTTYFNVLDLEPASLRRAVFSPGSEATPIVVPSGNKLFAITPENGTTVTVYSGTTGERTGLFRLASSASGLLACPATWDGSDAAIIVSYSDESMCVFVVNREGVLQTIQAAAPELNSGSVLTFGISGGVPLLVLTDGGNRGVILDLQYGGVEHLVSPAGTCPVVAPSGYVYGRPGDPGLFTLAPRVRDVFFGDFNRDGREDIAWAGSRSLFCLTSAGLFSASPASEAVLEGWGTVEGSLGLGARWSLPDGKTVWTRLNNDGFGVFQPSGALNNQWEGRFHGERAVMTGIMNDSAVLVAAYEGSGTVVLLTSPAIFWGDADGSGLDVFACSPGEVLAVFNPLQGDGLAFSLSAHSTDGAYSELTGYRMLVFGNAPAWRVFTEREGQVEQ